MGSQDCLRLIVNQGHSTISMAGGEDCAAWAMRGFHQHFPDKPLACRLILPPPKLWQFNMQRESLKHLRLRLINERHQSWLWAALCLSRNELVRMSNPTTCVSLFYWWAAGLLSCLDRISDSPAGLAFPKSYPTGKHRGGRSVQPPPRFVTNLLPWLPSPHFPS